MIINFLVTTKKIKFCQKQIYHIVPHFYNSKDFIFYQNIKCKNVMYLLNAKNILTIIFIY